MTLRQKVTLSRLPLVRATATMGVLLRPKVPGHESLIRVTDPRPLTLGWHSKGNVIACPMCIRDIPQISL